jgi:hypothetical protein
MTTRAGRRFHPAVPAGGPPGRHAMRWVIVTSRASDPTVNAMVNATICPNGPRATPREVTPLATGTDQPGCRSVRR